MRTYQTLVAVLGWEERFLEGIKSDIKEYSIESVLLIRYLECNEMTDRSREQLESLCEEEKVSVNYLDISDIDTVAKWKKLRDFFSSSEKIGHDILLEISTMPRDTIWTLLSFFKNLDVKVDYVYHAPQKYNDSWLSKEPGKPRLLFNHSGISRLGKKTALIILTGFEIERTKQLVYFFEPKKTILGLQVGVQFDNEKRNIEIHELIKGYTITEEFYLNAYDEDNGYQKIKNEVEQLREDYNIIITSLGPKPTAIAIYKVFQAYPEIALAYVPSKEFNPEYSSGISQRILGSFK